MHWLESNSWKIISYDFPQSGTGILLHPNAEKSRTSKNEGGIIPDILAARNSIALFFENKDRFVLADFEKIKQIKTSGNYSNSLHNILAEFKVSKIFYGIGIPANEKDVKKSLKNINEIDFLVSVGENKEIYINHDEYEILP